MSKTPARPGLDNETGSSTTELVLLMPVVLLVVMLIVQFGLWMHARQVVTAAAQEGLSVAQRPTGSSDAGQARAEAFLAEAGGLRDTVISVERDTTTARIEVVGLTPAVVPGLRLGVSGVAEGPVERFVPEPQR